MYIIKAILTKYGVNYLMKYILLLSVLWI
jgi:hypothetical protein